jgi:hypothetical protein
MAKKSAPKKKTPTPAAKGAPKKSAPKTAPSKTTPSTNGPAPEACYVSVSNVTVTVSAAKGKAGGASCHDFDAAKNAAIDGLIAAIEAAEEQLAACKRATTIVELSAK